MRRYVLTKYLWVVLMVGTIPVTTLYSVVVWNGPVVGPTYLASVDPTIDITGNVLLGIAADPNITVFADTANMTVNVLNAPWVITANDTGGAAGGQKGLNFRANAGFTVILNLNFSLEFLSNAQNFVVSFSGAGNMQVNLADGSSYFVNGNTVNTTGTYFLIDMDTVTHTPNAANVTFTRQNQASDNDVFVAVGVNSLFGFMGTDTSLATQTAIASFDATNNLANVGRLRLLVGNDASFAMQGYLTSNTTTPLAANITLTSLAGNRAILQTQNDIGAGAWSGPLVVNSNTVLTNFRSNPWCAEAPLDANGELIVGFQPGFIVGKNGAVNVVANTYLDYVANELNVSPTPTIPADIITRLTVNGIAPQVNQIVKDRNPSAFLVDGPATECLPLPHPQINLFPPAKIYFRSSCNEDGSSPNADFTVDPTRQFVDDQGNGCIVFDVEGTLDVTGSPTNVNTALNILSLYENNTGGSVLIEGTETNFKLRPDPYAMNQYTGFAQYGKGCFFVNGRMNLFTTSIQHTDIIHKVFDKNIPQQSETSYIGGESFFLCLDRPRPHIMYYNSYLYLNTSAAFTGVDQATPSYGADDAAQNNTSNFIFYYNGYAIDQGTGRILILGSNIGALASDLGTIIDNASHFDTFQETRQFNATNIVTALLVRPNNDKVTQGAPVNQNTILGQYASNSLFLAYASNISIGTPALFGVDPCDPEMEFDLTAQTILFDNGDYIVFGSQGGVIGAPDTSVETGQGGIFVDQGGLFELSNTARMQLSAMIGLGFNGAIDIRSQAIEIDPRVGITYSNLDLNATQIISAAGSSIPNLTLDWKYTVKNTGFIPYNPPAIPAACNGPVATTANITGLPVVNGYVEQLQIQNSRVGDPAHIMIDNGHVRELVIFTADPGQSGVAPIAVVAMQNDAIVGLGPVPLNPDSNYANVNLGLNGVTLMPNGNCQVRLNSDLVINNVCHVVPGPNFGGETAQRITFTSEVPHEIRIKTTGVLDVSLFTTVNQQLAFASSVSLVCEPGARILTGSGLYVFTNQANWRLEPYLNAAYVGTTIASSDVFRVKVSGNGNFVFEEDSYVEVPRDTALGIESAGVVIIPDTVGVDQSNITVINCPYITNMSWVFQDAAQLRIGSPVEFGGALQVGNTVDQTTNAGAVTFSITLNGINTLLDINSQGMFGTGIGIVNKPDAAPNTWTVAPLFNHVATNITLTEGVFRHNQIYDGSNVNAALWAIGAASAGYNFAYDVVNSRILGGGNIALISAQTQPTVLNVDGVINANLSVGLMSSRFMLEDPSIIAPTFPTTAALLFNYLKITPYATQNTKRAALFDQGTLGTATIGYVNGTAIVREIIVGLHTNSGPIVSTGPSAQVGVAGLALDPNGIPRAYASQG